MTEEFKNKTILITGGTGSIGSALAKKLLAHKPKQIRVLSRDESKQYYLMEKLGSPANLRLLIGDIRDRDRLETAFENVDVVFHTAALKHVPFCEYNPSEAVKTNIFGSQNIISAALKSGVKKVIAVSTDKAVNPVNVMGTSKLMMEKLFINANYSSGKDKTKFSCVRFGNVAWARGSVLRLWKKQADREGKIKITDERMTRFLMSKDHAIELMLRAAELARGGEVFIFKMPAIAIGKLKDLYLKKYHSGKNIAVEIIGNREGEKMDEELLAMGNGQEQIFEDKKMYIIASKMPIYNLAPRIYEYPEFKEVEFRKTYSSREHIDEKAVEKLI